MRITRRKSKKPEGIFFRYNEGIRVPEVRLIDENETHIGVMPVAEALAMARERGWDLVEINPAANPPIAKIADFGQFKYQKEKEARKQKARQKTVEVKGIRLSLRIGEHDLEMRKNQSLKFLEEGNRVRAEIILKGRERAHTDLAYKIIEKFVASLGEVAREPMQRQGGVISVVVGKG